MKAQKLLPAIFFLVLFDVIISNSQDLINSYKQNYNGVNTNNLIFTSYTGTTGLLDFDPTNVNSHQNMYNGEYQIILNRFFPWVYKTPPTQPTDPPLLTSDAINNAHAAGAFLVTYKIEAVSFPFYCPCAFDISVNNPSGGCAGAGGSPPSRIMKVPDDANFNQTLNDRWTFSPSLPSSEDKLFRFVEKRFDGIFSKPADLVSYAYCKNHGIIAGNDVFPHTILKHTVSILAGTDIQISLRWS